MGHGHVDAGDFDTVEQVAHPAGGQQAAGLGTGGIEEGQLDRRSAAGYAIDGGIAVVAHAAARGHHVGIDEGIGVEVADAHPGHRRARVHQPVLDGEGTDGAEHVAAVGRGVDPALGHHDLHEQVVDIGVRVRRAADDRHLAGLRTATADTVDFQLVARAHQAEQQLVALQRVSGQVVGQKDRPFRSTASHEYARYRPHDASNAIKLVIVALRRLWGATLSSVKCIYFDIYCIMRINAWAYSLACQS
jgi:hypothetical protein